MENDPEGRKFVNIAFVSSASYCLTSSCYRSTRGNKRCQEVRMSDTNYLNL